MFPLIYEVYLYYKRVIVNKTFTPESQIIIQCNVDEYLREY